MGMSGKFWDNRRKFFGTILGLSRKFIEFDFSFGIHGIFWDIPGVFWKLSSLLEFPGNFWTIPGILRILGTLVIFGNS